MCILKHNFLNKNCPSLIFLPFCQDKVEILSDKTFSVTQGNCLDLLKIFQAADFFFFWNFIVIWIS